MSLTPRLHFLLSRSVRFQKRSHVMECRHADCTSRGKCLITFPEKPNGSTFFHILKEVLPKSKMRALPTLAIAILILMASNFAEASMVPEQITGNYNVVRLQDGQTSCPDGLYVRAVEVLTTQTGTLYIIPHKNIYFRRFESDKGLQCDSTPISSNSGLKVSSTILRRMDNVQVNKTIEILSAFYNTPDEVFYLGYEAGVRKCGSHTVSDGVISLWTVPSKQIKGSHAGRTITFKPGVKYIYYFDKSEPCLYQGNAEEKGSVSQIPSPTPSSATTDSGNGAGSNGTVVTSNTPEGTGQSPSGISSPAPAPGSQPSTDSGTSNNGRTAADNPECFPGSARLMLKSGRWILMSEARIGDMVLSGRNTQTGKLEYSPIVLFSHRSPREPSTSFVTVRTDSNMSITATSGHLVYVNGVRRRIGSIRADGSDHLYDVHSGRLTRVTSVRTLPSARSLQVSERLKRGSNYELNRSLIDQVAANVKRGLFNPHTMSGDIAVDGVLASCYTSAVHPGLAHMLLWPIWKWFDAGGSTQALSVLLEGFSEFYLVRGDVIRTSVLLSIFTATVFFLIGWTRTLQRK